jgi:hypothetical protein
MNSLDDADGWTDLFGTVQRQGSKESRANYLTGKVSTALIFSLSN